MERFSPDDLLRLIGGGDDRKLEPLPTNLTRDERIALRRARIDAIDRAQAEEEQKRNAPAIRQAVRPAPVAEDKQAATQAWLKDNLGGVYRLGPVWALSEAREGHAQWIWRAAVAAMLTKSRHDIKSAPWAISQMVRALAAEDIDDPRNDAHFVAWDNWPKALYAFARVPFPERYNGTR